MADNFGLKIGVEGEREFKKALSDILEQTICVRDFVKQLNFSIIRGLIKLISIVTAFG